MLQDRRPAFPRRRSAPSRTIPRGDIRPIYAAVFDLDPDGYEVAREAVLDWVRNHWSVKGCESALQGGDFDLNQFVSTGLVAQAARSPDGNVTVVRLQHRERTPSGSLDRLRDWRTEATIERDTGRAWIATRQWFAGVAGDPRDCRPPGFISELWRSQALSDLDVLEPQGRVFEYEQEADELAKLILDFDRDLPVIVVADGCPLVHERVARDFTDLAHVVRVTREARLRLNSLLKDSLGLSHGALQTFHPRVQGSTLLAPASRWETIIGWHFAGLDGPPAFSKWLRQEIANALVTRLLNDPAHVSYEEIRAQVLQAHRPTDVSSSTASLDAELLELALNEVADLQKEIAELTDRAKIYLNEKTAAEEAVRQEDKRNNQLQLDKIALQHALNAKTDAGPVEWNASAVERLIAEQPVPKTIFDALEQAERLFDLHGQRVRFSEEATEGAMEALAFKRPRDVQAALIRLGFLWSDARASGRRLDEACQDCTHFPCAMFESETTMRLYGNQRQATVDGTIVTLEKHVKLGGGRKDASARIYFGDQDGEILIGHVGRHLDVAGTQ